MKRIQVTEEEARIIEDFRRKTAVVKAFNEGIDTALAIAKEHSIGIVDAEGWTELHNKIQAARRTEKA